MATHEWRPLFDLAIRAYDVGEVEAGRHAGERLLARADVPDHIRWQARRNQTFFAPKLAELSPSTTLREIAFAVPPGWSRFNPSIAAAEDGSGYRLIVRSANYRLDRLRYTVNHADRVIRTTNYLLALADDLSLRRVETIDDRAVRADPPRFPVVGCEDCRLIFDRGIWRVVAAVRDRNPGGVAQIAALRLDADRAALHDLTILSDAGGGRHEKNWVPLATSDGLFFIYSCHPTVVLRFDDTTGAVTEVVRRPGPVLATDARGGSPAIQVEDGFLFLVHEVVLFEDDRRVYLHRFVLLTMTQMEDGTGDFAISRLSPPFIFRERGVEFAAGLARRGEELIASFGVEDRDAYLATVRLDEVLALLQPVADEERGDHGMPVPAPEPVAGAATPARRDAAAPDDPRWHYYRGDTLQGLAHYAEAIEAYRAFVALQGKQGQSEDAAWACYRAAECSLALDDPDAAVASCAAGLAHHPGLAELPWLAAYATWRGERFAHAVSWAHLAVALGRFRGHGSAAPRGAIRHPAALYEGPYDVLRFALRALGDEAGATDAERLYQDARAVREAADLQTETGPRTVG